MKIRLTSHLYLVEEKGLCRHHGIEGRFPGDGRKLLTAENGREFVAAFGSELSRAYENIRGSLNDFYEENAVMTSISEKCWGNA